VDIVDAPDVIPMYCDQACVSNRKCIVDNKAIDIVVKIVGGVVAVVPVSSEL
jgi:hypothetical protein